MNQTNIRNFCVVAHIDHGKSTLADRLLELTGTVAMRDMQAQILDSNPIERERGITIKLAPVRMHYVHRIRNHESGIMEEAQPSIHDSPFITHEKRPSGQSRESEYILNLIDTPGHVDFGYEVSRSLAACEGALLVVDATQGVQAQTLANLAAAREHHLAIVPIINKIDMPQAQIEECAEELSSLGFSKEEIIKISAKTGENVDRVLEAIVERIPPPRGNPSGQARALVFSSQYDPHKGVVVFVRVVDGEIGFGNERVTRWKGPDGVKPSSLGLPPMEREHGMRAPSGGRGAAGPVHLRFMASGAEVAPIEIGYFTPAMKPVEGLRTGEVGYTATGLKDVRFAKVGDTVTQIQNSNFKIQNEKFKVSSSNFQVTPLAGYKEPKPMVFLSLFPIDSSEFQLARESMEKLRLSDSAFTFRPISSSALGHGFHCGFLGLLHAEIVQERLSREFDLNMIATAPSVEYLIKVKSEKFKVKSDEEGYIHIQSATEYPDPSFIEETKEPIMELKIFTPKRYVGAIMQLVQEKRGEYMDLTYVAEQAEFTYLVPLSEMIIDFFDRLKSVSEGYASLDYEFFEFQKVDVVKIDILVNHEKVDALSFLAVANEAHHRGAAIVERLAQVIPRQQFEIPIQAAIGGQIVARSDVKAFRKDVIQKLYGGDRTRKDKLLKKQKKGKARMKMIGKVEIPQSAFFQILKRE